MKKIVVRNDYARTGTTTTTKRTIARDWEVPKGFRADFEMLCDIANPIN